MEVLPELSNRSPERQVLVMSGVMDLMSRAGALPADGIPRLAPSPEEDLPVAIRSAEALSEAIAADMTRPVLEWAAQATLVGKVAPPAVLIKLLPLAQKHPELVPVLGNRGMWLASQQGMDLATAATSDLMSRRAADSGAYREWLAANFDTMDWKERARAVTVIRAGLSLADEPLLERGLLDRRKEVREPACDLLASLGGSRVQAELSNLALSTLALERSLFRKSLTVNPPDPVKLPKWLPTTPSRVDFGPKALALFDVVRYLPPSEWESGVAPEQFLDLAAKTDYAGAILDGLQEAAVRFADQDWIDVLFEFFFSRDARKQECWAGLTYRVSEAVFDRVVSSKLGGILADPNTAAWTLTLRKKPLSLELSRVALSSLRTNASHHYCLRDLAAYLHPAALSLVDSPYSDAENIESTRKSVQKILDTRRRMLSSLVD